MISSAYLVGVDSDNTTVQRQFIVKSVPTQGILLLNDKLLGVGSTFTQDDIDNNRVKCHNGNEISTPTTDGLGTTTTNSTSSSAMRCLRIQAQTRPTGTHS